MTKPVVLIAEELSPPPSRRSGPDFEIRQLRRRGPRRPCCRRSATSTRSWSAPRPRSTPRPSPPRSKLKVVARAGVGLDNVDVAAATQAGVMVVNAPTSNIVSRRRAGHRAAARRRPQHPAGQRRAEGRRVEAQQVHRRRALREDRRRRRPGPDRRPGRAAAVGVRHGGRRLRPLRLSRARAAQMGVRLVGLDELLEQSRLHHRAPAQDAGDRRPHRRRGAAPGQADGADRQRRPRRDRRRARARRGPQGGPGRGRRHRRLRHRADAPTVAAVRASTRSSSTPHLGASTDEAQEKAGVAVARSVRLALAGELVPDAVNVSGRRHRRGGPAGHPARREARPDLHRARRERRRPQLDVEVRGEITAARRGGARAGRAQGRVPRRRRGAGVLRQRAACSPRSAGSRSGWSPTRTARTTAT